MAPLYVPKLIQINYELMTDAKFDADLFNISEVTSRKTKWPRFFGLPCSSLHGPRTAAWETEESGLID